LESIIEEGATQETQIDTNVLGPSFNLPKEFAQQLVDLDRWDQEGQVYSIEENLFEPPMVINGFRHSLDDIVGLPNPKNASVRKVIEDLQIEVS